MCAEKKIVSSHILYYAFDTMREILQLMRTKSAQLRAFHYNYIPQRLYASGIIILY